MPNTSCDRCTFTPEGVIQCGLCRLADALMSAAKPPAPPSEEQLRDLWNHVTAFIVAQEISCAEDVCQSDRVIENAYEFIEKAGEIVGWYQEPEET